MSDAVAAIMKVAATIAVVAAVVIFVWQAVGDNTPADTSPTNLGVIRNEQLCEAAGGTWTDGAATPCAAS